MPLQEDFQRREILRLASLYRKAKRDILLYIRRLNATDFQKARGRELLKQIDATLADLKEAQRQWLDKTLPDSYRAGQQLSATANGIDRPTMSAPHRAALGAIAGEIGQRGEESLNSVAPFVGSVFRRAKQQVIDSKALMEVLGVSQVEGLTIPQLSNRIVEALRTGAASRLSGKVDPQLQKDLEDVAAGRVIRITGKDGIVRGYDLEHYGETVARSASRMASSEGVLQTQQQVGEDLVQVSVHSGACAYCMQFQGKVYSISGKTPGYPVLEERPPFHPRCEHVLLPVVREFLQSRGLEENMQAFSNDPKAYVGSIDEYTDLLSRPAKEPEPTPPPLRAPTPPPRPLPATEDPLLTPFAYIRARAEAMRARWMAEEEVAKYGPDYVVSGELIESKNPAYNGRYIPDKGDVELNTVLVKAVDQYMMFDKTVEEMRAEYAKDHGAMPEDIGKPETAEVDKHLGEVLGRPVALAEASRQELRTANFIEQKQVQKASMVLMHGHLHGTYSTVGDAKDARQLNYWHYYDGTAHTVWQEGVTEAMARKHWYKAGTELFNLDRVAVEQAFGGKNYEQMDPNIISQHAYTFAVRGLQYIGKTILGFDDAGTEDWIASLKFTKDPHNRIIQMANDIVRHYHLKIPDDWGGTARIDPFRAIHHALTYEMRSTRYENVMADALPRLVSTLQQYGVDVTGMKEAIADIVKGMKAAGDEAMAVHWETPTKRTMQNIGTRMLGMSAEEARIMANIMDNRADWDDALSWAIAKKKNLDKFGRLSLLPALRGLSAEPVKMFNKIGSLVMRAQERMEGTIDIGQRILGMSKGEAEGWAFDLSGKTGHPIAGLTLEVGARYGLLESVPKMNELRFYLEGLTTTYAKTIADKILEKYGPPPARPREETAAHPMILSESAADDPWVLANKARKQMETDLHNQRLAGGVGERRRKAAWAKYKVKKK